VEVSHEVDVGTEYANWNTTTMENVFDEWLANYEFDAYYLADLKYLGVACSCSS